MRRFFAFVVAVLALAGCTKVGTQSAGITSEGTTRHAWTQPGVLRIGIQDNPNTLSPLLAANTTENMITRLTFDVLISVDETGKKRVPMLASEVPTLENGGISKDGLTITYKLRHNVKWQDGAPFTSKDVKFTFSAIMNNANNVVSRRGYDLVKSVDTPDDFTVVFHMKQKFAPAVDTLFGESDSPYTILPEHLLAKYPNLNQVPFNQQPIGTGPFKVAKWIRGDHIELVPNDDYFLGKPKLKSIIIKTIPDENTMINQLKTHEIDWQFEASPSTYKELKTMSASEVKLLLVDHNGYESIQFNTSRPLLKDKRVRQAMAYAIDRAALVEKFTYGSARVATEDLPNFMWAYNPNVTKYVHDIAKAKSLMAAAGWTPGPDGILAKNGKKMRVSLVYNQSNSTRRVASVQIQAMLRDIGVDAQIKTYPASLLFAPYGMGGILQTGKFDLGISGWFAGIDPDDSSNYLCQMIPPGGYNYTRYCSPQMQAAQAMALEHYDEATRKKAYDKIQELLADDMPQLFLWWPRQIQAINPDFTGFAPNPVTESWNAYQWSI